MATKIIQSGETLSGIAQAQNTTLENLLKLNPNITDPNKIIAGNVLNIPDVPVAPTSTTEPTFISSDLAKNQFEADKAEVQRREEFITKAPAEAGALTIRSDNPAFQSIINQANTILASFKDKGIALTPTAQSDLNKINSLEFQKTSGIAKAREGVNENDVEKTAEGLSEAKIAEKTQQDIFNEAMKNIEGLQTKFAETLVPTERETEISKQLKDLRVERQLLPLELRKEGISAAGIQGRQVEDERVRAIQEQNLLLELGLEKEARQMKGKSLEAQIGFIKDNFDLRTKIEDRLKKEEDDIAKKAQDLSTNSLSLLGKIVDEKTGFGGLAWEDLDATSQSTILNLIKPFPDLTPEFVSDALGNVKQQQIYERVLEAQTKLTEKAEKPLSIIDIQRYQEIYPDAGIIPGDTQSTANAKVAGIVTAGISEDVLRQETTTGKEQGASYEDAINQINSNDSITNKDQAIQIANEVYGIKNFNQVFGKGKFEKVSIADRANYLAGGKLNFSSAEIRSQLIKDGYDKNIATEVANTFGGVTAKFINNITNYLFGE